MQLEEPKYSIEQVSARCGKTPAYVAARLRLTELAPERAAGRKQTARGPKKPAAV